MANYYKSEGRLTSSDSSGNPSAKESGSSEDDDSDDPDYAPRNSKAKASQSSNSSSASTRLLRWHASKTSPLTVIPATTGTMDSRRTVGSSSNPPVKRKVVPALTKTQGSPRGVDFPSSTSAKPNTSNSTSEPKPVTWLQITTATATQALSSGTEALHDAQDGVPKVDNSSNADLSQDNAALAPNHSPSQGTVVDRLTQPQNVLETNAERVLQGEIVPNLFPVAEVEMNSGAPFTMDVVGPDRSVDRDAPFDLPIVEPSTSTIDTETSPLSEGVRPEDFALISSSVSKQNDHMDVD